MHTTRHLMTATDAAQVLRLTPARVSKLAKAGEIPSVILPGNQIRFDEAELWLWVAKFKRPATARELPNQPEGPPDPSAAAGKKAASR